MLEYVYLAGGTNSSWRRELEERWIHRTGRTDLCLIDPFVDSKQGSVYEFTRDDLAWVAKSCLVFGYVDYHSYTGTALEFGYAHALGKPIVYVTNQPRVDSMMAAVASAVFTDLGAAARYAERYLPKLPEVPE